jgi:hypothetical protein
MKMRIQGNAIRFRLNRREVEQLSKSGRVSDSIQFPGGAALTYAVELTPGATEIEATYSAGEIRLRAPQELAQRWAETDQTGMTANRAGLEIVLEKDFQCLHKATVDSDAFPNPLAVSS